MPGDVVLGVRDLRGPKNSGPFCGVPDDSGCSIFGKIPGINIFQMGEQAAPQIWQYLQPLLNPEAVLRVIAWQNMSQAYHPCRHRKANPLISPAPSDKPSMSVPQHTPNPILWVQSILGAILRAIYRYTYILKILPNCYRVGTVPNLFSGRRLTPNPGGRGSVLATQRK